MESMLEELLVAASKLAKADDFGAFLIDEQTVLARLLRGVQISAAEYRTLDDYALWLTMTAWRRSPNEAMADLADRLTSRRLYKCVDIGRLQQRGTEEHALMRFKKAVQEHRAQHAEDMILVDSVILSPYTLHGYDEPGAFQKILIGKDMGGDSDPIDVATRSAIVKSLDNVTMFRMYVEDDARKQRLLQIWERQKNG